MKKYIVAALLLTSLSGFSLTPREALDFLYASMSLPDKADYSEEFYRSNVDASFKAREEMPWGKSVPDREFLHFVLPVRVNNENLDHSRMVFYDELKDRVKGMSMKDAILEVNHWCHEKVTYKPSDSRTSSPLSSVSQAIGRCGEESTFTVAALRSVGIPARQIYTPRWAHTDDNHAWVEAWADGEWHFLGACEPEPILDLAWFNDPASRGILMNTNVTGDYRGPEEVLLKQPLSTKINVTANYAPVATLPVKIVDANGKPVDGAYVYFCIYNYAEYYPAVYKIADSEGNASLTSGLGDLVVWASDGDKFGFAKGNAKDFTDGHPLTITLDKDASWSEVFEFDLTPPPAGAKLPTVTPQQRAANDLRTHREDSIRNAYMATFCSPEIAKAEAQRLGVDEAKLTKILSESRGNHMALVKTLWNGDPSKRNEAVSLLLNVSEKDRRDIPADVIIDHVENAVPNAGLDPDFYNKYVLNPRVEIEFLRAWRRPLSEAFAPQSEFFRKSPDKLVEWVRDSITLADAENPMRLRMSPLAVLKTRKGDIVSRNIFFVAVARSLGIPARIDPVTGATQYSIDGKSWIDADFGTGIVSSAEPSPKGKLMLTFTPEGYIVDPKYYSQFTISHIEGGVPRLLEFDEEGTLSKLFNEPYELEEGQYILTSGQRLANGGVLARSEVFAVNPGETTTVPLKIRQDDSELSVIGSLNAENIYHDMASGSDKSLLSTTGRGFYVLGLISPNHEPSAHALNDISAVAKQLSDTGRKIMVLFESEGDAVRFDRSHFPNLPDNVVFGIDNGGVSRKEIVESLNLDNPGLPIFVVADTFNRIVWVSTGYTIGLGDTLLNTLSRLD